MHEAQPIGTLIRDQYRILNVLGQGGSGITYEAEEITTERRVALKELSLQGLSDWKKLALFEREAQVLASLNHPAIPQYVNYFQVDTAIDRFFYIAQELVEGASLADLVAAKERFAEVEVQRVATEILQVLDYLHRLNPPVIHRDVKPQNIIRRKDGRLFLVDFGAVQTVYRHTVAFGSTIVGTYGYMAPEQFQGQAYPNTDLYGLGATALNLLTHQQPAELPKQRLKYNFRPFVTVSSPFADWLDTLLEPLAEDRFPSAQAALSALNRSNAAPSSPTAAVSGRLQDRTYAQGRTIRAKLLQRLQYDVNARLESILLRHLKIDLKIVHLPQAGGEIFIEQHQDDLSQRFLSEQAVLAPALMAALEHSEVQGRLLVMGEAGAGKTTELLALAHDLLQRASTSAQAPIPIILELSTWSQGTEITAWIVGQLQQIYGLREAISQRWLENQQFFLLLDGLDEATAPQPCRDALDQFLQATAYPHMVVCCRDDTAVPLQQLRGAVCLQPLSDRQIQDYLYALTQSHLWPSLTANPDLSELARQPLYLSMLVVAYQGQPLSSAADLFNLYIHHQLTGRHDQPAYTRSQSATLHTLRWLACQMERLNAPEYLIETMQPSWLSPTDQRSYQQIVRLVPSLAFSLMGGLMGGLVGGLNRRLLEGLVVGLLAGLKISHETHKGDKGLVIQLPRKLAWPIELRLIGGLAVGATVGLAFGVTSGLLIGLEAGLFDGITVGLTAGVLTWLGLELSSLKVQSKSYPNQGIRAALRAALIVVGTGSLIGSLMVAPFLGLRAGLGGGLIFGVLSSAWLGLGAASRHYVLRFLLAEAGDWPWRCDRFLNHAARRRLIQQVGGRYRFQHRLLRQHLAAGPLHRDRSHS